MTLPPGKYDLPPAVYHADPQRDDGWSVSSTTCRHILPPDGCPALVDPRQTPRVRKREFDLGSAVHTLVLGKGDQLRLLVDDDGEPFGSYNTKASRAARDAAYTAGEIPLLADQHQDVHRAADAVLAHPTAGRLLEPGSFEPEQTLIWRDEVLGIWRRAMVDALASDLVVDVKSTDSTAPASIGRTIANYRYDQQEAFYDDGIRAVLGEALPFVFIFIELKRPFLIAVHTIPADDVRIAKRRNRRAMELWSWCVETETWPGRPEEITEAQLPRWHNREEESWG